MSEAREARTYTGGCHCGKVRYEVETALTPVLDCNCSICQKRGALWTMSSLGVQAPVRRGQSHGLPVQQAENSSPVLLDVRRCFVCARLER